mgnify:CR=1 FL=1
MLDDLGLHDVVLIQRLAELLVSIFHGCQSRESGVQSKQKQEAVYVASELRRTNAHRCGSPACARATATKACRQCCPLPARPTATASHPHVVLQPSCLAALLPGTHQLRPKALDDALRGPDLLQRHFL